MKNKLLLIMLVIVLVAGCLATLAACDEPNSTPDNGKTDNNVTDNNAADNKKNDNALQFEKKYILEDLVNREMCFDSLPYVTYEKYYVFHADGTCEYFYKGTDYANGEYLEAEYSIHLKYTYLDNEHNSLVCFYDSLDDKSKFSTGENVGAPYKHSFSGWYDHIVVSKDVIYTIGNYNTYYVNEDFVKQIPHFNEETAADK